MTIRILSDSASDIPEDFQEKYNIKIIPMPVRFGDKTYYDGAGLSTETFFDMLEKAPELPVTSQVSPQTFLEIFKEALKDSETLVVITISSKGSGNFQSANLAREMLLEENPSADIEIIDSMTFSLVTGSLVIEAAKMAQEGASKEEILSFLKKEYPKMEVIIAVDDLSQLKKGGRISTLNAVIGGVLDIKPILTVKDGMVASLDKVRGKKNVVPYIMKYVTQKLKGKKTDTVYILHGPKSVYYDELVSELEKSKIADKVISGFIGPTVGVHIGPTVAALAFKNI